MTRKKGVTAEELLNQLRQDPAHMRRMVEQADERELQAAGIAEAAAPLLRSLNDDGYEVSALSDVWRHAPLDSLIVTKLLHWLPRVQNERLQEQIVRLLGAAGTAFPGRVLANLFDQTASEGLRWAIANTIAEARPTGVAQWIGQRVESPASGKAREMLALGLARVAPPETANPALLRLLDELPGHVAMALAECGGEGEAEALKRKSATVDGWVRREVDRALRTILRRLTDV